MTFNKTNWQDRFQLWFIVKLIYFEKSSQQADKTLLFALFLPLALNYPCLRCDWLFFLFALFPNRSEPPAREERGGSVRRRAAEVRLRRRLHPEGRHVRKQSAADSTVTIWPLTSDLRLLFCFSAAVLCSTSRPVIWMWNRGWRLPSPSARSSPRTGKQSDLLTS